MAARENELTTGETWNISTLTRGLSQDYSIISVHPPIQDAFETSSLHLEQSLNDMRLEQLFQQANNTRTSKNKKLQRFCAQKNALSSYSTRR